MKIVQLDTADDCKYCKVKGLGASFKDASLLP